MKAADLLKIDIQSEIGRLDAVLLHRPGCEVENMTPRNVQRALYSDILNLAIAQKEYEQLYGVLSKVADVYEVREELVKVLDKPHSREELIRRICETEDVMPYFDTLMTMTSAELARVLIEGLPARTDTLTAYFRNEFYALYPLYNFYFTRDAAVTLGNHALICRMANKVRMRESFIMDVGEVLGSFIAIGTCSKDEVHTSVHAAAESLKAFDGQGVEGGDTVKGGVEHDIESEDNVIDGHVLAIGELNVLTHGDVIVNGAVFVLGDLEVGNAVIGVVGAVVGTNFAFDTLQNDSAFTVGAKKTLMGQAEDLRLIVIGVEEGRELTVEVLGLYDESVGLVDRLGICGGCRICGCGVSGSCRISGSCGSLAASCEESNYHDNSKKQSKQFLCVFHVWNSSLYILNYNGRM